MSCAYPNCRETKNLLIPVIEIPTIRTVGIAKPVLHKIALDRDLMARNNLNTDVIITQYREMMEAYEKRTTTYVETDEPTQLLGQALCLVHKQTYKLTDWVKESDWEEVRQLARDRGFEIQSAGLIQVKWLPEDWEPKPDRMELLRD